MTHIFTKDVLLGLVDLDKALLILNRFVDSRYALSNAWLAIIMSDTHLEIMLASIDLRMARS